MSKLDMIKTLQLKSSLSGSTFLNEQKGLGLMKEEVFNINNASFSRTLCQAESSSLLQEFSSCIKINILSSELLLYDFMPINYLIIN